MLFAIDHGNSAVKTTNFVFTSGLAEYPVKPPLQTDVLEWGGKFWALSGQRISFMRDKTRDHPHSLCHRHGAAEDGTTAAYAQRGAGGRSAARTLWHPAR